MPRPAAFPATGSVAEVDVAGGLEQEVGLDPRLRRALTEAGLRPPPPAPPPTQVDLAGCAVALIWAEARHAGGGRPVLGYEGTMPWHVPEDLARFQRLTEAHPVVMGRRTWDSLPGGALPRRTNIVLTRHGGPQYSPGPLPPFAHGAGEWDALAVDLGQAQQGRGRGIDWPGGSGPGGVGPYYQPSLTAALALAEESPGGGLVWVIGGAEVFAQALPLAQRLEVTEIDLDVPGDTFAPDIPPGQFAEAGLIPDWQTSRTGTRYRFRAYHRL